MTRKPTEGPDLFLLANALVDDLMALSDDDLLREVREDEGDPERLATEMREQLQARVVRENKARLVNARSALNIARAARAGANVISLPLTQKQQILSKFAAADGRLRERLTMAARKGEGATEREIDDILKDLVDLGAIDDEGNPH
ncbi:hypothetical protein [Phenylobacterium sp.]|jgi:hypothetical protein|uniref:hypothetical protein n=1 Tax=Phenylobacterium sp. TaxID=1871053 RepID=UPI002E318111|nr:hypothetical protein [Phenylobacterium sp.]HEX3367847.1 hypothetical protein [Phenylobacterium sp.]